MSKASTLEEKPVQPTTIDIIEPGPSDKSAKPGVPATKDVKDTKDVKKAADSKATPDPNKKEDKTQDEKEGKVKSFLNRTFTISTKKAIIGAVLVVGLIVGAALITYFVKPNDCPTGVDANKCKELACKNQTLLQTWKNECPTTTTKTTLTTATTSQSTTTTTSSTMSNQTTVSSGSTETTSANSFMINIGMVLEELNKIEEYLTSFLNGPILGRSLPPDQALVLKSRLSELRKLLSN